MSEPSILDTYLDNIPFGSRISSSDILENFDFLDDWEERYRFIMDLGKELPGMPVIYQSDDNKVVGCQSQVWVVSRLSSGQYQFGLESDAIIVRGLICIVLSALNYKNREEILNFNMDNYFSKMDLASHLSMQRGNGLRAMVKRIQNMV